MSGLQGFFSKFLMGGTQNFRSPSDVGGLAKKIPTEAKTAHLMQNKAIFCYFKHEIQLFKVLLSLKVVNFDTKMYPNFFKFLGTNLGWGGGGGQALVQKRGQVSDGGELAKFLPDGGTPSLPRKKTLVCPDTDGLTTQEG